MEEDKDKRDTTIKGRILTLVNKIKGQAHKAEEPTEKEQAVPCEQDFTGILIIETAMQEAHADSYFFRTNRTSYSNKC